MEISTSQVDLENISLDHEKLKFDPQSNQTEIETLARSIVRLQGLLEIPIVKRTGVETCELLSGALEYYAYLEARKIDPSLPDRLRVFILDQQKIEPALEQIKIFEDVQQPSIIDDPQSNLQLQIDGLNYRILNQQKTLEDLLRQQVSQVKTEILQELKPVVTPLKENPVLTAFNTIDELKNEKLVLSKLGNNLKTRKFIARLKDVLHEQPNGFSNLNELIDALGKDRSLRNPANYLSEAMLTNILKWLEV